MIDSHAHLDRCDGQVDRLVAEAEAADVGRILTVGTDPSSNRAAVAIAEQQDCVYASLGHHPHGASGFNDEIAREIESLASHVKVRAIGEAGLDYYRDLSPRSDQARAFITQIELARSLEKPLVVHTRKAAEDTMHLLDKYGSGVSVVIHCFSVPEHMEECIERGYHCSFAGNITYPKAAALQAVCSTVPDRLLLIETDSPYLSPREKRGKPNTPANIVDTAHFVAELRGQSYDELNGVVEKNAASLFGW